MWEGGRGSKGGVWEGGRGSGLTTIVCGREEEGANSYQRVAQTTIVV